MFPRAWFRRTTTPLARRSPASREHRAPAKAIVAATKPPMAGKRLTRNLLFPALLAGSPLYRYPYLKVGGCARPWGGFLSNRPNSSRDTWGAGQKIETISDHRCRGLVAATVYCDHLRRRSIWGRKMAGKHRSRGQWMARFPAVRRSRCKKFRIQLTGRHPEGRTFGI